MRRLWCLGIGALVACSLVRAEEAPAESSVAHLHGLIWMAGTTRAFDSSEDGFQDSLGRFERNLRTNPHIDGVSLTGQWKQLEPKQGQFQFGRLDAYIKCARQYRKPYKLVIVPGTGTPDDVFEQGAASIGTKIANKHRQNFGEVTKVPVPWDPVFQRRYYAFVGELARRYGDDPLLSGVTVCIANFMSSESHLPRTPADLEQWSAAAPDYAQRIEQCWKEAIDRYAKLFPRQQLTIELSSALPGMDDGMVRVVKYGMEKHPDQFAVQNDQLNGRNDNSGIFSYRVITELGDKVYHGFQTVAGWQYPKAQERQGTMEKTAHNSNRAKGSYLEVWYGDGANVETCARLKELLTFAE
jgi:hypothetical protein